MCHKSCITISLRVEDSQATAQWQCRSWAVTLNVSLCARRQRGLVLQLQHQLRSAHVWPACYLYVMSMSTALTYSGSWLLTRRSCRVIARSTCVPSRPSIMRRRQTGVTGRLGVARHSLSSRASCRYCCCPHLYLSAHSTSWTA